MLKRLALLALLMLIGVSAAAPRADADALPVLKPGSKGAAAKEVQFRLLTAGYFKGSLTAVYGRTTRKAVIAFQRSHGLSADGIVGPRTWAKLKKTTVNRSELYLLARVIHAEARGESFKGQVAVGAVIMNRLKSPRFPKTVKGVILERNAFSAVRDGQIRLNPGSTAFKAAKAAVRGADPTGNALYYYNPTIARSAWFKSRTATKRIGNHLFAV